MKVYESITIYEKRLTRESESLCVEEKSSWLSFQKMAGIESIDASNGSARVTNEIVR